MKMDGVTFTEKRLMEKIIHSLQVGDWEGVEESIRLKSPYETVNYGFVETVNYGFLETVAIIHCCRLGQCNCIEKLIHLSWEVNGMNRLPVAYPEAMFEAVRNGHIECIDVLLECGMFRPQIKNEIWLRSLMAASKQGEFDKVKTILEGGEIEDTVLKDCGNDIMDFLVMYGCPTSYLQLLVDRGVNADGHDNIGLTPLICAVLADNVECVSFLLEQDVSLDTTTRHEAVDFIQTLDLSGQLRGQSALAYAACLRRPDCLQMLLEAWTQRAEGDITDKLTKWPLLLASYYGQTEAVSTLIEVRGNILRGFEARDHPLVFAMKSKISSCLQIILNTLSTDKPLQNFANKDENGEPERQNDCLHEILIMCVAKKESFLVHDVECLRILLTFLDTNSGFQLEVLLHLAAMYNFPDSVRLLLDCGLDIDWKDEYKDTALYQALTNGHDEIVDFLIKQGANVNAVDLFEALGFRRKTSVEGLQLMIDAGIDLDKKNNKRHTVFSFAAKRGEKYLQILVDSGQLMKGSCFKTRHKKSISKCIRQNNLPISTYVWLMKHGLIIWRWRKYLNFDNVLYGALNAGVGPVNGELDGLWLSPLGHAMACKNFLLVSYLLANLYFFPEDYRCLFSERCSRFMKYFYLDHVYLQPWSLQAWSFLAISKAVSLAGPPFSRSKRVDSLPLPRKLKAPLNFQTDVARTQRQSWKHIGLVTPGDLIFLRNPRIYDKVSVVEMRKPNEL